MTSGTWLNAGDVLGACEIVVAEINDERIRGAEKFILEMTGRGLRKYLFWGPRRKITEEEVRQDILSDPWLRADFDLVATYHREYEMAVFERLVALARSAPTASHDIFVSADDFWIIRSHYVGKP